MYKFKIITPKSVKLYYSSSKDGNYSCYLFTGELKSSSTHFEGSVCYVSLYLALMGIVKKWKLIDSVYIAVS